LTLAALATGGALSYLASERPDGLEWSMEKAASGAAGAAPPTGKILTFLASIQEKTALFPDYGFKKTAVATADSTGVSLHAFGTSASGIIGALAVLALALVLGLILRKKGAKGSAPA